MLTPEQRESMPVMVLKILGPEKAGAWWGARNPAFGGTAPWMMTLTARGEQKLYNFILDAYENHTALTVSEG